MKLSNWKIGYHPAPRMGGHGFSLEFTPEFAKHAKAQTVDGGALEQRLRTVLGDVGFSDVSVRCLGRTRGSVMKFEGGLCWWIGVPGNAAGLSLERYKIAELDNERGWTPEIIYADHNLDSASQVVALVSVMSEYISLLENTLQPFQRSNSMIFLNPASDSDSINFRMSVAPTFVEFARKQKQELSPAWYQGWFLLHALRGVRCKEGAIRECERAYGSDGLVRFDGGLLEKIVVPGNDACMVLNRERLGRPVYECHNITTSEQACALLSVITRYVYCVECLFAEEKSRIR